MKLGDKIRMYRKALGLTQTELGAKLGVKVNAVSKWECGRVEDIPTSKIKALANLFGVEPSYLIDDESVKKDIAPKGDAEAALDAELIRRLIQLTPEEVRRVNDFVQGLIAARSAQASPRK